MCIPYKKMLSSEFSNFNDEVIKTYFYFRVFLCILKNILAYVFWENELQIGLFYFILLMCVNLWTENSFQNQENSVLVTQWHHGTWRRYVHLRNIAKVGLLESKLLNKL